MHVGKNWRDCAEVAKCNYRLILILYQRGHIQINIAHQLKRHAVKILLGIFWAKVTYECVDKVQNGGNVHISDYSYYFRWQLNWCLWNT